MFKRWRKSIQISTPEDIKRRALHTELLIAQNDLSEATEIVIVRSGVLDLYPNGPDREQAEKDLESAKKVMIGYAGTVDRLRNETRKFINENNENFVTTKDYDRLSDRITSHTIIENAYKNFFK